MKTSAGWKKQGILHVLKTEVEVINPPSYRHPMGRDGSLNSVQLAGRNNSTKLKAEIKVDSESCLVQEYDIVSEDEY